MSGVPRADEDAARRRVVPGASGGEARTRGGKVSQRTDQERQDDSLLRQVERGREFLRETARLLDLIAERLPVSVVAERIGMSKRTVYRRMRTLRMVDGRGGVRRLSAGE